MEQLKANIQSLEEDKRELQKTIDSLINNKDELLRFFVNEWNIERASLQAKVDILQKQNANLNVQLLYYRCSDEV